MKLGAWPKRKKNAGICLRGHARVPENLYEDKSNGRLMCRLCHLANQRNRRKSEAERRDAIRYRYRTGGRSGGDMGDEGKKEGE